MPYIVLAFVNLPWCPLSKAGEDDAACQGVLLITRPHSAAIARVVQQAVQYGDRSAMVINVGLYAACFLSLYVLNATKLK